MNSESTKKNSGSVRKFPGAGLLIIFLLVFLFPILQLGKTLYPADTLYFFSPWSEQRPESWTHPRNPLIGYDQVLQFLPLQEVVTRAYNQGKLPLWNSHNLFGTPLMANTQPAAFFPLTWLSLIMPLWAAFNVKVMIKLFIAGFFAYRWMKLFSREEWPAVFAGVGAMFCSYNIVWLNHTQSNVSILLPAAYYYSEKLARRPGWPPVLKLLIVICLQLLGGHVKSAFLAAIGTGLYFLVRIFMIRRDRPDAKPLSSCLLFATAYGLGTLLAAAQLIPFLQFIGRSHTLETLSTLPSDTLATSYLFLFLNPNLLGHPVAGINWGSLNYNEGAVYLGLPVLFILLLILPSLWRSPKEKTEPENADKRLIFALLAINAVFLLMMFGFPPLVWLASILPVLKLTDLSRLGMLVQLNAVLAAGLSFALLLERRSFRPTARHIIWVAVGLMICLTGIIFLAERGNGNLDFLIPQILHCTGFIVGVAILIVAFIGDRIGKIFFSAALCLILFADLFLVYWDYNPAVDKKWLSQPLPTALQKIRSDKDVFRTVGLDFSLPPNTALLAGVHDISGYGNPLDKRTHQFLTHLFSGMNQKQGMRNLLEIKNRRELEMLRWLNVKYILARKEIRFDGSGDEVLKKVYQGKDSVLYENQNILPRAYIVNRYEKLLAHEILSELQAHPAALNGKVYLEEDLPESQRLQLAGDTPPPLKSSVNILSYEEERVLLDVSLSGPGLLVMTDLNFPGWRVWVDGQHRPIHQADYLFRAVFLEAGDHRVEFIYQPASFFWGCVISASTVLLVALITFRQRKNSSNNI